MYEIVFPLSLASWTEVNTPLYCEDIIPFFFAVTDGVTLHVISPLAFLSDSRNSRDSSICVLRLAIVVFFGVGIVLVIVPYTIFHLTAS